MDEIFEAVYQITGVTRRQMVGRRHFRPYVRARQMAAYLAHIPYERSLPMIGRMMGNRHHTTIQHAIDTIEILKSDNPVLADQIRRVEAILEEKTREKISWNTAVGARTKTAEACFAGPGGLERSDAH